MKVHLSKYKYLYIFLSLFLLLAIIFSSKFYTDKSENSKSVDEIINKKVKITTSDDFIEYMNKQNNQKENITFYKKDSNITYDKLDNITYDKLGSINSKGLELLKKENLDLKNLALVIDNNKNIAVIDKSSIDIDELSLYLSREYKDNIYINIDDTTKKKINTINKIIETSNLKGGLGYLTTSYLSEKNYKKEKEGIDSSLIVTDSLGSKFNTNISINTINLLNYGKNNLKSNKDFMNIYNTFDSLYLGSDMTVVNEFYSSYIKNLNNSKFSFIFDENKNVSTIDYSNNDYIVQFSIYYKNSKVSYKTYTMEFLKESIYNDVKENVEKKLLDIYGSSLFKQNINQIYSYNTTSIDGSSLYVILSNNSITIQFN